MDKKTTQLKNSSIEWVIENLKGYKNGGDTDTLSSFERLIDELEMIKNLK